MRMTKSWSSENPDLLKSGFDYTDIVKSGGEFLPVSAKANIQLFMPNFKWQSLKDNFHNLIILLTKDILGVVLKQQS